MNERTEREIRIGRLDLDLTLDCGQVFGWRRVGEGAWTGVLGDRAVTMRQSSDAVLVDSAGGDEAVDADVRAYLRAADDLANIQKRLSEDPVFSSGLEEVEGLRLIKMDEWECMISYVLATNSNIPRIRKMISAISEGYGQEVAEGAFAFPSMESLREASAEDLRRCGLGYRAEYVNAICGSLDVGDIDRMKSLPYEDLRCRLMEFPGIGDKVADCVSLFGFGRLEAFPIDVWVRRAMDRLFDVRGSYDSLRRFGTERFGDIAGYAQEYLFYNERGLARRGRCVFSEE